MSFGEPDKKIWYEDPGLKWVRRAFTKSFNNKEIPPAKYMHQFYTKKVSHKFVKHHHSHAAAGYYTSPFKEAVILTVDAIGEWDTVSISVAKGNKIERKETIKYPHSLGILYSAFTQRCGLKPAEEEYI